MTKQRLDTAIVQQGLARSRSQADSWIKLGQVRVDGAVVSKPEFFVRKDARLELVAKEQYVSRAGLKLASVARLFKLDFRGKIVLDVGSSTGGFTDYALQHGASRVLAVDVGTNQLHPSLRSDERIELYEKTDIRDVVLAADQSSAPVHATQLSSAPDIIVIDVSFVSLREVLPHIATLASPDTHVVAMVKPQFEAGPHQLSRGIIKNDAIRRQVLKDFEQWVKQLFIIQDKRDSEVAGSKGNRERFYVLKARR